MLHSSAAETVTAHSAPETASSQPLHRIKEQPLVHPAMGSPIMLTLFAFAMVVAGVLLGKWLF